MSISQEYKRIYAEEIISKCKGVIFRYSPVKNKYDFLPFSHGVSGDAVERLTELMRKNLLFYCYGEEEMDITKRDLWAFSNMNWDKIKIPRIER